LIGMGYVVCVCVCVCRYVCVCVSGCVIEEYLQFSIKHLHIHIHTHTHTHQVVAREGGPSVRNASIPSAGGGGGRGCVPLLVCW